MVIVGGVCAVISGLDEQSLDVLSTCRNAASCTAIFSVDEQSLHALNQHVGEPEAVYG